MSGIKRLLAIVFFGISLGLSQYAIADQAAKHDAKIIFNLVNAYRVKQGLSPLEFNEAIARVAESHSRDMADKRVPFGHTGFNGRMRQVSLQLERPRGVSENVAYTYLDVTKVVNLWLESPAHRRSIVGNFNLSGIGIARDGRGRVYATQIFVLR